MSILSARFVCPRHKAGLPPAGSTLARSSCLPGWLIRGPQTKNRQRTASVTVRYTLDLVDQFVKQFYGLISLLRLPALGQRGGTGRTMAFHPVVPSIQKFHFVAVELLEHGKLKSRWVRTSNHLYLTRFDLTMSKSISQVPSH